MNEWMHEWVNEWINEWMNEKFILTCTLYIYLCACVFTYMGELPCYHASKVVWMLIEMWRNNHNQIEKILEKKIYSPIKVTKHWRSVRNLIADPHNQRRCLGLRAAMQPWWANGWQHSSFTTFGSTHLELAIHTDNLAGSQMCTLVMLQ